MSTKSDRRDFVQAGLAGAALLAAGLNLRAADTKKPKLNKAVKYAMIGAGKTVKEKFELIKKLGFQGVEIDSPSGIDRVEMLLAQEQTGIKVHGAIDSVHWGTPLSSPDAAVRAKGLASLKVALHDASFFGADTVLLVPGVARDGVTYEQCWERSQAEVRKALPVAEKLSVKIACEVVWNDFITKPEQMIEYVDSFKSPWVGTYFDCSNMIKYGVPSADWIRKLGKRVLKFDFKGFSLAKFKKGENPWVGIGEGDENWPDIVKALGEVGYDGWATAEVNRGDEAYLKDVAERMNKVLELS
ncbi:MAG TPA: sugar phosphate isomerase/epimerase family protein [Gemmataceae bacterium]|nr:sugar phosphate isomerase/epimerase family protein [Gemmataceae bacterium]